METLPNHYQLEIPAGCFPLSTDSMVLSHFVRLPKNARVLDLGSGCGTLGLLLCSRDAGCAVTGIERDERAHAAALANICRNGLENRLESLLVSSSSLAVVLSSFLNSSGCEFKYSFAFLIADP